MRRSTFPSSQSPPRRQLSDREPVWHGATALSLWMPGVSNPCVSSGAEAFAPDTHTLGIAKRLQAKLRSQYTLAEFMADMPHGTSRLNMVTRMACRALLRLRARAAGLQQMHWLEASSVAFALSRSRPRPRRAAHPRARAVKPIITGGAPNPGRRERLRSAGNRREPRAATTPPTAGGAAPTTTPTQVRSPGRTGHSAVSGAGRGRGKAAAGSRRPCSSFGRSDKV